MQRRRGRIKADIGADRFLLQKGIKARFIGDLMNEAPLGKRAKEIGFERGHELFLC